MQKIKSLLSDNKYIMLTLAAAAVYIGMLCVAFGIHVVPLEIVATVFVVIEFDLFRREKSSAFVFNVMKCVLLALWFASIGLWGQVAFRSLFAVLSLVGMIIWLFPGAMLNKKSLRPAWLRRGISIPIWVGLVGIGLILVGIFDIMTAMDWTYVAFGTIGNLLLVFKRTDAWGIFLASEMIGLPLFLMTESWMYVLITVFMICIEIGALRSWGKTK